MLGAIAGDIIGSTRERRNERIMDFILFPPPSTFTDDSVLTAAIAVAILKNLPWEEKLQEFYRYYPHAGYGQNFAYWAESMDPRPYDSYGNGSAMRVSAVGWAYGSFEEVVQKAEESAAVTHNHPEGIKGAKATAGAIYMARTGNSKDDIRDFLEKRIGYDVHLDLDKLRESYRFDVSCQGSVPHAFAAFFAGNSFEEVVRIAISIGGDSDTIACIAGSVAEAFFGGVPEDIGKAAWKCLDNRLRGIVADFHCRYQVPGPVLRKVLE